MSDGISYQNKDILWKVLSETYKEKSFSVYGINLPKIKQVLPTNLPKITANEKAMDNLFLLEDNTLVIVDYESTYNNKNKIKYLNYIIRVLERNYFDLNNIKLKLIVIYTGDVEVADPIFETDCLTLKIEQAFLSAIDGQQVYKIIAEKISLKQPLSDDDIMKLIILPLTLKGKEQKQDMLEKVVALAEQINDDRQQIFTISGVLVASDKFIDKDYLNNIRRRIDMTKIGQLYEKERIETKILAEKQTAERIAKNLLDMGNDILDIMKATGLTEQEIINLRENDDILE